MGSRFGAANPATGKGTVMKDLGVRWARHSLVVTVADAASADRKSIAVLPDGARRVISAGKSRYDLHNITGDDCAQAAWAYPSLRVRLGAHHKLMVTLASARSAHINTTYLNLQLDAPAADPLHVGGVLGYSADAAVLRPAARDADVVVSALLVADSKSSKYQARPLDCSAARAVLKKRRAHAGHKSESSNRLWEGSNVRGMQRRARHLWRSLPTSDPLCFAARCRCSYAWRTSASEGTQRGATTHAWSVSSRSASKPAPVLEETECQDTRCGRRN